MKTNKNESKKGTIYYMLLVLILSVGLSLCVWKIFKTTESVQITLLTLLILLGSSIRFNQ